MNTIGPFAAGLFLNGVPGTLAGTSLTQRIGMPELWFRENDRNLEGQDAFYFRLGDAVGASVGILENIYRGTQQIGDGQVWRGVETMMPKALRDAMKAVRYSREGLLTSRGDVLADGVGVADAFRQAVGFTPARVAERYDANTRLRNRQSEIEDARRKVLAAWRADLKAGGVSQATRDAVAEFNAQHPYWPITGDTIRQSIRAADRYSQQMEGGLRLNPRLDRVLRAGTAAPIW